MAVVAVGPAFQLSLIPETAAPQSLRPPTRAESPPQFSAETHRARLRGDQHLHVYRNNIIFQNDVGLETEFGTVADNPVWQNNLVFGNTTNYQGTPDLSGSAGNISSDPLLVNSASGDYHLQSSSPAIDAGSSVDAPTVDFDGMSRPIDGDGTDGAAFDIGAFEAAAPP